MILAPRGEQERGAECAQVKKNEGDVITIIIIMKESKIKEK